MDVIFLIVSFFWDDTAASEFFYWRVKEFGHVGVI